jgi:hypothetical protein
MEKRKNRLPKYAERLGKNLFSLHQSTMEDATTFHMEDDAPEDPDSKL